MDEVDYLRGSNGSGEASRLTVTNARSALATTLLVDSVTNWPTKFIATSGVLNTETGVLDPATVKVFKGHIDSGHIEIDAFAPGYTDAGNSVGDVVILKPNTKWADVIGSALEYTKDSIGDVKLVVSATQPAPVAGKTVIWFEPL